MGTKGSGSPSGTASAGAVPTSTRLTSIKAKKKRGHITWSEAHPQMLQECVERVVEAGGLISFSKTSDGGALVLYVKDGTEIYQDYFASVDALEGALETLHEQYAF